MEIIRENRNGYAINCYNINITNEMKKQCLTFATNIITSNNQFSRLIPSFALNDFSLKQKIEIQRTYVGKLGELAFLEYLHNNNFCPNIDDMFKIYEGQNNTDGFDFKINKKTIDVKTGFRNIHSRLLINLQQFHNIPKDYYVAIHLNGIDIDSNKGLIDLNNITIAQIKGCADYNYLNKNCGIKDFGEGDAKFHPYNRLLGIDLLLKKLR